MNLVKLPNYLFSSAQRNQHSKLGSNSVYMKKVKVFIPNFPGIHEVITAPHFHERCCSPVTLLAVTTLIQLFKKSQNFPKIILLKVLYFH